MASPVEHSGLPLRLAVIGSPIRHSLSAWMHSAALKLTGLAGEYRTIEVAPADLPRTVESFRTALDGWNITIPHKEAIIPLLDEVNDLARSVGAVNTVVNRNGRLSGMNTDVGGIVQTLREDADRLENASALLLGAGGAARAVVYALAHAFHVGSIAVAARTTSRGEKLRDLAAGSTLTFTVTPWETSALRNATAKADLIVNCTPIGLSPNTSESPLPADIRFRQNAIVFDLVYRPLRTRLMETAKNAGCRTLSGVEMFIHQGAEAFEAWTGQKMPVDAIRPMLHDLLKKDEGAK